MQECVACMMLCCLHRATALFVLFRNPAPALPALFHKSIALRRPKFPSIVIAKHKLDAYSQRIRACARTAERASTKRTRGTKMLPRATESRATETCSTPLVVSLFKAQQTCQFRSLNECIARLAAAACHNFLATSQRDIVALLLSDAALIDFHATPHWTLCTARVALPSIPTRICT